MQQQESHDSNNLRKFLTSERYYTLRAEMQRHTQEPKVQIDYKCFQKTPEERVIVKNAISDYKKLKKLNG